jgi:hypothetical protein
VVEAYLEREIRDIMCGEGAEHRERHELLRRWRERLGRAGLACVRHGHIVRHGHGVREEGEKRVGPARTSPNYPQLAPHGWDNFFG